jgi:hypothetical protein
LSRVQRAWYSIQTDSKKSFRNPKPNQIHSESIKNPTRPWRIYQIHIMIPAIGFQEFTIGMLTPPKKKEIFQKFRGVVFIIRQPT